MSYKLNIPAFVAAALLAASGTAAFADVPESPDPIKVIMNDWTGQHVSTKIAGALLEKMGYNIEYVSAGALPQHPGLAQGNLHFQAEVWSNNVGDLYPKMVESGEIVVLGDLGLEPKAFNFFTSDKSWDPIFRYFPDSNRYTIH